MMPDPGGRGLIASRRHPLIIRFRKVSARPQAARRERLILLDGLHLLEEALASSQVPEACLHSRALRRTQAGRTLLARLQDLSWPLREATEEVLASCAPTRSPQGILALMRRPDPAPLATDPLALLLDGVQDPGNVGMLARTAWAFGATALLTTASAADPYHTRALRASSGALLHLRLTPGVAPADLAPWIDEAQATLVGLTPRGGTAFDALELRSGPLVVVMGSEGKGLDPAVAALCAQRCTVPMVKGCDSIGVAAAGSIALYLASRRRLLAAEGQA